MAPKTINQEMPPTGGYEPLTWQRSKLRTVFGVKTTIGVYLAATIFGNYMYYLNYKLVKREEVEMHGAALAILPMLVAERDRAFLKQLRKNREEERELMKNVPEWKVGTYFGEPIYITQADKFNEPGYYEFTAHASFFDSIARVMNCHFL